MINMMYMKSWGAIRRSGRHFVSFLLATKACAICAGSLTGGDNGFGSSPNTKPKSMWKSAPTPKRHLDLPPFRIDLASI